MEVIDRTCTAEGWNELVERVEHRQPNRVLIGACLPYVYARKIGELARKVGLDPALMDVVDIRSLNLPPSADGQPEGNLLASLKKLTAVTPTRPVECPHPATPGRATHVDSARSHD